MSNGYIEVKIYYNKLCKYYSNIINILHILHSIIIITIYSLYNNKIIEHLINVYK